MHRTVFKLLDSGVKITLLLCVVGFSIFAAGFDKSLTGAFLNSTLTAASNSIAVGTITEPCTEGQRWLAEVVSSSQGPLNAGGAITDLARTDPTKTLGANDATTSTNFFSLGRGGVLVGAFADQIEDGVGVDFSIYETTNGRMTYPLETARVEISQDGDNWVEMLTPATSRVGGTGVASYDLTSVGVPWFKYIRLTDTTDFSTHPSNSDGFDVDAIGASHGICDNNLIEGRTISGMKFHDANENALNDTESGLEGWTMYAATHLIDLTVEALNTPPATTPVLQNGATYLLRVSGTYYANDNITADAKYSVRLLNTTWTDDVQNYQSYGPTLLDLQIDGSSPNWGSFNDDHTYWIPIVGAGVSKSLELYDLNNGNNNSGSLTVSLYQVIASDMTDSSGNYAMTVPLTSDPIYVFELLQDNWRQTVPGALNYYYQTVVTDGNITRDFGNVPTIPTGNVQLTKYVCVQDAVITTAQRPDVNGNFPVPTGCELQPGARFGYIFQEDKTDLSPPYPGLNDSTAFIPLTGSTNASGVLLSTLLPSTGRYMLAELDDAGQRMSDGNLLGFLCTGDSGTYTNNYEATFVPEDGTAYCAIFNRVTDASVVLNEILPNPAGVDDAAMPEGEWVELYNNSAVDIDVAGWVLYNSQDSSALVISTDNSDNDGNPFDAGETIVPAGGYLVVYRDGTTTFSLNEAAEGDTVRLYNASLAAGDLIDSHTYLGVVAEEKTIARIPDGTGPWVDPIAQPGRENTDTLTSLDPFVKVWQLNDNFAVIGLFEGLNHSSADYTLSYTRDSSTAPVLEQVMGSVTLNQNNQYVFNIFIGTQSDQYTQPHFDVTNVHLDVLFHDNGMPTRQADLEGSWIQWNDGY